MSGLRVDPSLDFVASVLTRPEKLGQGTAPSSLHLVSAPPLLLLQTRPLVLSYQYCLTPLLFIQPFSLSAVYVLFRIQPNHPFCLHTPFCQHPNWEG